MFTADDVGGAGPAEMTRELPQLRAPRYRERMVASGLAAGLASVVAGQGLMPAAYVLLGFGVALGIALVLGHGQHAMTVRASRSVTAAGIPGGLLVLACDWGHRVGALELVAATVAGVGAAGAMLLRLEAGAMRRIAPADRSVPYLVAGALAGLGALELVGAAAALTTAGLLWQLLRCDPRATRLVPAPVGTRPSLVLPVLAAAVTAVLGSKQDLGTSPLHAVSAFSLLACLLLCPAEHAGSLDLRGLVLFFAAMTVVIAATLRWPLADLACAVMSVQAIVLIVATIERAVAQSLVLHTAGALVFPAAAYLAAAALVGS